MGFMGGILVRKILQEAIEYVVLWGSIFLLGAVGLLISSCAPKVLVKPGMGKEPTVLRVHIKAEKVILCGSMTDWQPVELPSQAGKFELSLFLPPGRYEYWLKAHDASGARLLFPEEAEKVDDGYGSENIVLRIP
jgi:hypothetical protein